MSKKTTAEAEAVAKGSNIAFAPGKLDFTSAHGQALLGHEISHAASAALSNASAAGPMQAKSGKKIDYFMKDRKAF